MLLRHHSNIIVRTLVALLTMLLLDDATKHCLVLLLMIVIQMSGQITRRFKEHDLIMFVDAAYGASKDGLAAR